MPNKYYAVRRGKNIGVFNSWYECEKQVKGFSGAEYKSFISKQEALEYLNENKTKEEIIEISLKTPYCFVDGSFNEITNTYGYGGFIVENGKKHVIKGSGSDKEFCNMRNVAGEIFGAMFCVKEAIKLELKELTIFYDYVGIEKWVSGEWKTNNKLTSFYHDFMKYNQNYIKLNFVKVKSHSGIEGNELADRLAKESVGIL